MILTSKDAFSIANESTFDATLTPVSTRGQEAIQDVWPTSRRRFDTNSGLPLRLTISTALSIST
jgi:hypothetical protein